MRLCPCQEISEGQTIVYRGEERKILSKSLITDGLPGEVGMYRLSFVPSKTGVSWCCLDPEVTVAVVE